MKIKRIIRKLFFWRDPKYIKRQVNSILLKAQKSGLLDSSSREMIGKILKFTHILVREVMVPRTEIIAVNIEEDIDKIIAEVIGTRHTRLPVYRETIDDVIGILNVKDVLEFWAKTIAKEDILAILSTPYYIPETKNAHLLFYELRENKKHMAVVIDEYGGTAGLVTLEDLLEEIVGDLHDGDEMISGNSEIIQSPDGSLFFEGRMEIEKVEEHLKISLGKGRYETLSGWILNHIKRIPLTGEKFQIGGLDVTIESADERRIQKVKLRKVRQDLIHEENF